MEGTKFNRILNLLQHKNFLGVEINNSKMSYHLKNLNPKNKNVQK